MEVMLLTEQAFDFTQIVVSPESDPEAARLFYQFYVDEDAELTFSYTNSMPGFQASYPYVTANSSASVIAFPIISDRNGRILWEGVGQPLSAPILHARQKIQEDIYEDIVDQKVEEPTLPSTYRVEWDGRIYEIPIGVSLNMEKDTRERRAGGTRFNPKYKLQGRWILKGSDGKTYAATEWQTIKKYRRYGLAGVFEFKFDLRNQPALNTHIGGMYGFNVVHVGQNGASFAPISELHDRIEQQSKIAMADALIYNQLNNGALSSAKAAQPDHDNTARIGGYKLNVSGQYVDKFRSQNHGLRQGYSLHSNQWKSLGGAVNGVNKGTILSLKQARMLGLQGTFSDGTFFVVTEIEAGTGNAGRGGRSEGMFVLTLELNGISPFE